MKKTDAVIPISTEFYENSCDSCATYLSYTYFSRVFSCLKVFISPNAVKLRFFSNFLHMFFLFFRDYCSIYSDSSVNYLISF